MSNVDAKFKGEIFRKDHTMIIAQNRHLASLLPVRLAYNASGYQAGRVLARNTVSGLYEEYASGGSSGLSTAACVLFEDHAAAEMDATTGTVLARGIFHGDVFKDKLLGLDSTAEGQLGYGAKTIVDATGINVLRF